MKNNILFIVLLCTAISVNAAINDLTFLSDTTRIINEKVTYEVSHDKENLYLNINTSDSKTMITILRLGLTVFFDVKGKKKEDVYIKYPSEAIKPNNGEIGQRRQQANDVKEENSEEERKKRKQVIQRILEDNYSQKAEYNYFKDSEEFHILLNTLGILPTLTFDDEHDVLSYALVIPKNKISTDIKNNLDKLSIGVKTVREKIKREEGGNLNGNIGGLGNGARGQRGRGQGRPNGGIRGQRGGRQGAGRQGGPRSGSPQRANQNKDTLLDFWFPANLNSENVK